MKLEDIPEPTSEELRDMLKQQIKRFTASASCAFCQYVEVLEERLQIEDSYCELCPFPGEGYERCVDKALLDDQTDNQAGSSHQKARRELWAAWYQSWLDDPNLQPPELEWKIEYLDE